MTYVLLAISLVLSPLAFRFWLRFGRYRIKDSGTELSEMPLTEDFVIGFLPKRVRAVWHLFVLTLVIMMFGYLHVIMIFALSEPALVKPSLFIAYLGSLILWLGSLSVPAIHVVNHERLAAIPSDPPE